MSLKLRRKKPFANAARRKKPGRKPQSKKLEFFAENGWRITAIPPKDGSGRTYDHLKEAIDHVIEDVDSRIKSNVRID